METAVVVQIVMGVVMTAFIPSIGWLFKRNIAQGEANVAIVTQTKAIAQKVDAHEAKLETMRVEMAKGFGEIKDELRSCVPPPE